MLNDERGSLRSRSAAAVSSLTLRQIGAELRIRPDQVHVFQALPRLSPDATPALRHIADFIAHALCGTRIDQAAG